MGELTLAAVCAAGEALLQTDEPEPADLSAFAVDARAIGPTLDREGLQRLIELFRQVEAHGHRVRDELKGRIGHAGRGRRALRGYGSLRSTKRCQHASARR